jgi:putative phosphoesterase
MLVAILSDIHDNVWKLAPALEFLRTQNTGALICCGDLCSPFVVGLLRDENKGYPGPIHIVFGNNDADLYRITQQAVPGRLTFHGELAEFVADGEQLKPFSEMEAAGKRIAVNHFNYLARPIAASGRYDVVFYGHNHRHRHERRGEIDVINPGAIMGYDPAIKMTIASTFVIYDTADATGPRWYEIATELEQGELRQVVRPYDKVHPEVFKL